VDVENSAARHTLTILPLLFRWPSGTHLFDFGNALRIRAYVLASGVFVGSISHAEMRDSFGIVQLSGKPGEDPGEKRKHCKANGESWKPGGGNQKPFLLVSRECSRGKERLTWSSVVPHGWI